MQYAIDCYVCINEDSVYQNVWNVWSGKGLEYPACLCSLYKVYF